VERLGHPPGSHPTAERNFEIFETFWIFQIPKDRADSIHCLKAKRKRKLVGLAG